jgi:hypothetical protein
MLQEIQRCLLTADVVEFSASVARCSLGTLTAASRTGPSLAAASPERILVSRCFHDHRPISPGVVLGSKCGVPTTETHIVKLGHRDEVDPMLCCLHRRPAGGQPFSRRSVSCPIWPIIGSPCCTEMPTRCPLSGERSRTETLETTVEWSVRDDRPDPLSVGGHLAISPTWGCGFTRGCSELERTAEFYRPDCERVKGRRPDLPKWRTDSDYSQCAGRLAGLRATSRRRPAEPAHISTQWTLSNGCELGTSRGCRARSSVARGDLHGLNILASRARGK